MLSDRRDELAHLRVQTVNRLQRLLSELLPGQRKKDLSALQAKALPGSVRPRDIAGKTRRRMAADELADLVAVDAKLKQIKAELKAMVIGRGSTLLDIHGVGPAVAARTSPTSATSPGSPTATGSPPGPARHRWTHPPANRSATACPAPATAGSTTSCTSPPSSSCAATPRPRQPPTPARCRQTPLEALRCLKRRLSDVIYRRLEADAATVAAPDDDQASPGGHSGATQQSSAVDLPPHIDTSDQPLPGPAQPTLPPPPTARKTTRKTPTAKPPKPTP